MKSLNNPDTVLLLKCLNGEANLKEQTEAWEWVHENDSHRKYYADLRDAWIAKSLNQPVSNRQIENSWVKVRDMAILNNKNKVKFLTGNKRIKLPDIHFSWRNLAAAVAIAFLMGVTGSLILLETPLLPEKGGEYSVIESPRGSKTIVTLTDGTRVWLNAESRLRFNKSFNKRNRDVYLEGEGYFVVARNENINFRVHASGIIIKALGTEFNVRAYAEDGKVETTLVKGSVSISRISAPDDAPEILLHPRQRASFYTFHNEYPADLDFPEEYTTVVPDSAQCQGLKNLRNGLPARVAVEKNINTEIITSWKEKRWVFERESLKSLTQILARSYDVNFVFLDPELEEFYLTGTLEEESLEQVLKAIQLTLPIDFQVNHNRVYLSINEDLMANYKHILRSGIYHFH